MKANIMSSTAISFCLGIISIIMGLVLIVKTWQYPFWALGGILGGMGISKGLMGLFSYTLATVGFIISGIGLIRQKKWAIVLFIIAIILWSSFVLSTR